MWGQMNELKAAVSEGGGEIFVLGSLWEEMGVRDGEQRREGETGETVSQGLLSGVSHKEAAMNFSRPISQPILFISLASISRLPLSIDFPQSSVRSSRVHLQCGPVNVH